MGQVWHFRKCGLLQTYKTCNLKCGTSPFKARDEWRCMHANGRACIHANIQSRKHQHAYKHTNIQTYKHTNIQTYKHTNIQTYKQTNIQTYKHANIQTCKHTYLHACTRTCAFTIFEMLFLSFKESHVHKNNTYMYMYPTSGKFSPSLFRSFALSVYLPHKHTHSLTQTHKQTHTRVHTRTQQSMY